MALRVLALHGFGQNASVFMEQRANVLVKKLRDMVTLHAIDAPHKLPYNPSLRAWWSYPSDLWDGQAHTIQALAEKLLKQPDFDADGLAESFELVLKEWSTGGYDGILGFSQGAILAAALVSILECKGFALGLHRPRFVVLISGFGSPVPRGIVAYPPTAPLRVPSLHIWGLADDHIPSWASQKLTQHFEDPQVYAHVGHHFVPQKAADIEIFRQFLAPFAAEGNRVKAAPALAAFQDLREDEGLGQSSNRVGAASATWFDKDELGSAIMCYLSAPRQLSVAQCEHIASSSDSTSIDPDTLIHQQHKSSPQAIPSYLEVELQLPGVETHERLRAILVREGLEFSELGPHAATKTSEDSVRVRLEGGWPSVTLHSGAKAMLLRAAGSEEKWLLAVLPADRKLSWKKVRALWGKATRMATEEEVQRVTGCVPGAVPPLTLAFPSAAECLVDPDLPDVINFNSGLRTRSMRMRRADFERVQRPLVADIVE